MKKLKMHIEPSTEISHINKEIYGHFSEHLGRCIYNGIYVGEDSSIPHTNGIRNDVIEAFKKIKMPVLRWPGGCYADTYHWEDGIGKKENRKKAMNIHWGGIVEDNSFGTHEFMQLCELVGCEPYIAGNLGTGTPRELSDWVEYMTQEDGTPLADLRKANGRENAWKLKFLGIGNESWGCGGNMRPEYYADLYRHYQSFCRNYSGNQLYKVACGPNSTDYNWTEVLMKNIPNWQMDAISLHYYTVPYGNWEHKGSAVEFTEAEYYETIRSTYEMEKIVSKHSEIMDKYDPDKNVGLIVDEWGTWFDVETGTNPGFLYQQNTMRDAIVAAINLNIFNAHSDRVVMANIAQAVNVLQAVILTEGEKMVLTPTYHIFDMYSDHQDNTLVKSTCEELDECRFDVKIPVISKSVSKSENGDIIITMANASAIEDVKILADIDGFDIKKATGRILKSTKINDCNDFENTERVKPLCFNQILTEKNTIEFEIPAQSVISLRISR